jgi:hypothetical protein
MLQHIRKPFVAFSALAAVLAMTGCQANGGGTLASACGPATTGAASPHSSAPGSAVFGFVFQSSGSQATGNFSGTYRDPCSTTFRGGVALRGTGLLTPVDPSASPPIGLGCVGFPLSAD